MKSSNSSSGIRPKKNGIKNKQIKRKLKKRRCWNARGQEKKRPQSLNSAEGAGERDEVLSSIGAPDTLSKRLRPAVRDIQRD